MTYHIFMRTPDTVWWMARASCFTCFCPVLGSAWYFNALTVLILLPGQSITVLLLIHLSKSLLGLLTFGPFCNQVFAPGSIQTAIDLLEHQFSALLSSSLLISPALDTSNISSWNEGPFDFLNSALSCLTYLQPLPHPLHLPHPGFCSLPSLSLRAVLSPPTGLVLPLPVIPSNLLSWPFL